MLQRKPRKIFQGCAGSVRDITQTNRLQSEKHIPSCRGNHTHRSMRLLRKQPASQKLNSKLAVGNELCGKKEVCQTSWPIGNCPVHCKGIQPSVNRRTRYPSCPAPKLDGNWCSEHACNQLKDKDKNIFRQAGVSCSFNDSSPKRCIVLVQLHAAANFQNPRRPNPGTKRVFERVKHLQDKFIRQRKSKNVDAVDTLNVGLLQAVPRYFNLDPGALFEE